jgi:hypothetical protein
MLATGDEYLARLSVFLDCPYDAILTTQQMNDLGVPPALHASYQSQHFLKQFAVGSWYDVLRTAHTFRTIQVPLSFADATALYRRDRSQLESLRAQISGVLGQHFPRGAFFKLDTRSPKDVPFSRIDPFVDSPERDRFLLLLDGELGRLSEWDLNTTTIAFQTAATRFLKVDNADEVLNLLLRSVRVFEELNGSLKAGEAYFECLLVFREWDSRVPDRQGYEFRGFVFNRNLTALTQYNDFLYFPELVRQKDQIEQRIRSYFVQIQPRLPQQHYLIDFICFEDEIKIIELNPFTTCAGSGLFDWMEDIEVIKNGPFQFRVRTEPDPKLPELMEARWIRYFNEYREKKKSRCLVL